ncbi:skin secretory protein xP2-like [Onychostruthus taczanowskii]|uniref:skin secretory protein xP2-like n=1 Tax=Onychostruthus taczanowskii TaxID=356909 RepID=UPI001B8040DB|nr:skin secretory protein xP2-like [Onychostruthus taczanowskii]
MALPPRGCGEAAVACSAPCAAVAPALSAESARLPAPRPPARGSPRLCPLEALGSPPAPAPPLYIGSHRPQPAPALTYMAIYGKQEALIWMRAGGPLLASEPGTGESRAGGPRPPRAEGPTPGAGLTPAMGSAAAALPQHRRSRETGAPAPAGPGQPAGSPHRTFHIRKQPYKSRFRRRLPVPYMAIPVPGWEVGGGGAQRPSADGRAPAPWQQERAEASDRERARPLPERLAQEPLGAPDRPRRRRRVFAGRAPLRPHPVCSARTIRLPPSPRRSQAPLTAAAAAGSMWSSLDAGSVPKAGAACSQKRGISGIPAACRDRAAPPAPDESGGGLPVAPDRDRPGSVRLLHVAENRALINREPQYWAKLPQPALTSAR